MKTKKTIDFGLFITVLILLSLGLIMVLSASMPTAYNTNQDVYYIFKRQLLFAAIGFAGMFIAANIDYKLLGKLAPHLLILSIILLILVIIPGIGFESKGTYRWFKFGPLQFQPSEVAKLSVILFFSYSLSKRREQLQSFFKGMMPYLLLLGVFAVLLLLEPHLSCTMIVLCVAAIIMFTAGAKIRYFVILGLPAVVALGTVVAFVPYMRARVLSFVNPWNDLQGDGWQAVQSLYAIGSGGLFGRGLGRSMQKFLYIPEPHNDFIFSVLAEELGFIGVLAVLLLFLIFIWRGLKIAMNASDTFGSLVATGITAQIAVQSLLNVAVVTSSIPPTGVSLPFFSYGGTALVLLMFEIGILLNISRYGKNERI
jgi:cell division protein FtsW